ncbi:MAG: HupE/UreJ family protein [Ottowia sp.]|nr:HupE/UreJ family protein [Ottowia sp.]
MNLKAKLLLSAALVGLPLVAAAHPGALADHTHTGFMSGLLHPLTGPDHLAAMLAVGMWSALVLRPRWVAPVAFVLLLLLGALAAQAGWAVPMVEPMIAASLLVIGLLMAARTHLPWWGGALLVGGFAFFHGAAHGTELAGSGAAAALAGMVIGTALLHGVGIGLGEVAQRRARWISAWAGAGVAALGSALLLRMAL